MRLNSKILSDGAVLQRGVPFVLSGETKREGGVRVSFQGLQMDTKTESRNWRVEFPELKIGGPYTLTVMTPDKTIQVLDILVGDVFFMSGQSNMELDIAWVYQRDKEEIDAFECDFVRQFKPPVDYNFTELREDLSGGKWVKARGADKRSFGAIGFFMAKKLYQKNGVPIGLIQTAVRGCPIESFLKKETVLKFQPDLDFPSECASSNAMQNRLTENVAELSALERRVVEKDAEISDRSWSPCTLPFSLQDDEAGTACYWFKKEIELSEDDMRQDAALRLGLIVNADYTYINGVLVGYSSYQYLPRRYDLPRGVLKSGTNEILVQVVVKNGLCRFWEGQPYRLEIGEKRYDLTGEWQYRRGYFEKEPFPAQIFYEYLPVGLYNAMIRPLMDYPISALLWYQGEANVGDPRYLEKFEALVGQFRRETNNPDLPVYYVQLDDYQDPLDPTGEKWEALRMEQEKALGIQNTFMIQAKKYGDPTDLHPQNKKGIGEEIAGLMEGRLNH